MQRAWDEKAAGKEENFPLLLLPAPLLPVHLLPLPTFFYTPSSQHIPSPPAGARLPPPATFPHTQHPPSRVSNGQLQMNDRHELIVHVFGIFKKV